MANSQPVEAPNSLISNSYLRITDVLAEGPIKGFVVQGGPYGTDPLVSTFYDDVQVRNLDGSYNFNVSGQGYNLFYTFGTTNQVAMSGFEKVENIVPLSSNTQITNPPIGAGTPKNVTATFNTTMYPDADSVKITMEVPSLYTQGSDGNVNGFVMTYNVDISLNNGPFINVDQVTINGKCTNPYLYTTLYTLPKTTPASSFYQWTVRISKPTLAVPPSTYNNVDIFSVLTQNTLFVNSIGIISSNSYVYPNTALVGTFIAADQFQSVPVRSYLVDGLEINVPNGYTPVQYLPGLVFNQACSVGIPLGNQNVGFITQAPSAINGLFTGISVSGAGIPPNSFVDVIYNPLAGDLNYGFHFKQSTGNAGAFLTYTGNLTFYNPNYPGATSYSPAVYPNIWTGDFQSGVWTNNPAWVFYDMLTNQRYGLGNYIQPQLVDKWGLYQIAQYCDTMVDNGQNNGGVEPRFTCNINLRQPQDAYNVLLDFCSVFRGMMYYANGTVTATQTSDKTAVFDYTNANVIKGQFQYVDSARNTRSTVANVLWQDPNNLYRDNTAHVEDTDGILRYGYIEKDVSAFACTSPGQAYRLGQWILLAERTLTETISFQVGLDSLYVRPGDVFNVYDNFRNNQNGGGRIVSFDSTRTIVTLDRPVVIGAGYNYTLSAIVPKFTLDGTGQVTGSDQIPLIHNSQIETWSVTNSPTSGTNVITLANPFSTGLFQGSPWILSVTGGGTIFNNSAIYQCLATTEVQPGIIEVVGLQYNTGINSLVYQPTNVVNNPINSGDQSAIAAPTNFVGVYTTGIFSQNQQYYSYLALSWTPPNSTNIGGYIISGDNGGSQFIKLSYTKSTGYNYFAAITGKVDFTVQAVSKGGVLSSGVPFSFSFPQVPGVDPNQIRFWLLPDGFGDLEQIAVFYNRPDPSVTSTRIFYSTGVGFPFNEVLDQGFYPAEGVAQSGVTSSGTVVAFQSTSFDIQTIASQSAVAQASNSLLYLIDNELMSVGPVTGQGNGQYQFGVNRGVLGTFAVPHSSNTTGWLFFQSELESFHSDDMVRILDYTGLYNTGYATRYFQIENTTLALNGGVVPAAPGLAYTLPNPAPSAPTQVTTTVGTGKIVRLNWTPPNNTDILEYQIYRATGPAYTDQAQIGTDVNTHYDDINVVLSTTYEYWVATVSQDEEVSALSTGIFATPQLIFPSGINPYPPIDPSQASIISSGNYFAQDGTLLASVTLSVPGTPTGAALTNVVIKQYAGGSTSLAGATIMSQITGTTAQQVTIFDLAPNKAYLFGTQAISNFGLFSADVVLSTLSPYTTPYSTPTPGAPGSAPATPVGLMASGGLGGAANFIQLNWTANTEQNLEEYGVYRNYVNSQPSTPFAYVGSNSFVDAGVTGNQTYYYWVSAYNRSEQQSALTSSVNAVTQQAPSAPTAITLNSSGFYNASDGTVLVDFTFNVPGLTANAVGQQLLYGLDGTHWMVANDLTNVSSSTAIVNDLTPGKTYYFGLQTYSLNGAASAITPSNPASYVVPSKSVFTNPNAPSNVQIGLARFGQVPIAIPTYNALGGNLLAAMTGSWTASPDNDIVFYEYFVNPNGGPPTNSQAINYLQTVPSTQNSAVYYGLPDSASCFMWVRSINTSQGISAWAQSPNVVPRVVGSYAGNLGAQNSNATQLTQVQIGTTATQSLIEVHFGQSFPITGAPSAVASATLAIDISAYGFNVAPDFGSVNLDAASHTATYRNSQSTSIAAYVTIIDPTQSATIINGQTYTGSMLLKEHV